ncbi:MAG: hypothetical protein VX242_08675 [Pseudomonadota bacterium]|nr:hypothetical protein [Pseudomonadota bacterium]MEE3272093.1 hypothetical protein [Pseudomonadota bacterium]
MKLHDVLQKELIQSKFDSEVQFQQFGAESIAEISELEPNILFEIGAQAWMQYVESGAKVNPQELASDFDSGNPYLFQKVEKIIKRKVIKDISFSYGTVNGLQCCQLLICRSYPNDLFIADVTFCDPAQPVYEASKKYQYHEFKSLGVFGEHLKHLVAFAKANGIAKVSLTTASNEQIPYFEKHGFKVEDTEFAKQAFAMGYSVPMYLSCE